MSRFILALCVTCLAWSYSLHAVELRPIMVTVVMQGGEEKEYALFSDNVDKIAVGQKADDLKPASSVDWKRIAAVKYGKEWRGIEYSKAMGDLSRGDWQSAIDGFSKTVDGKYEKLQVESHLGMSQAYAGLKNFDEAVKTLNALLQKFPQHRDASDVVYQIGLLQLRKGDAAATEQAAVKLDGMKEWSPRNISGAALLRATVAKKAGNIDAAVKTISTALTQVDGSQSPDAVSGLVSDLMNMLVGAEKYDEAIKVGMANQWWPNANDDVAMNVHLRLAQSYLAREKLELAFHHAVLATSSDGVSPEFLGEAKNLAKQIVSLIKKANEDNQDKVDKYAKALGNL